MGPILDGSPSIVNLDVGRALSPGNLMPDDSAGALGRAWLTALGAIATAEVVSNWTGQSAASSGPTTSV